MYRGASNIYSIGIEACKKTEEMDNKTYAFLCANNVQALNFMEDYSEVAIDLIKEALKHAPSEDHRKKYITRHAYALLKDKTKAAEALEVIKDIQDFDSASKILFGRSSELVA